MSPAYKPTYIRIHAAITKVETEAAIKFEGKLDTAPAKFFIPKENNKLLDALSKELAIGRAEIDQIRVEGDKEKWPKK